LQVEGGLAAYKRRAAELDFKTATAYLVCTFSTLNSALSLFDA